MGYQVSSTGKLLSGQFVSTTGPFLNSAVFVSLFSVPTPVLVGQVLLVDFAVNFFSGTPNVDIFFRLMADGAVQRIGQASEPTANRFRSFGFSERVPITLGFGVVDLDWRVTGPGAPNVTALFATLRTLVVRP